MNRISSIATLAAVLGGLLAAPVQAAISRTYVASYGNNANSATDCNFSAPCRSFQTALNSTLDGGEILAIDGSGYGPVTIDRSVSIIANPGVFAGIGVFSGGTGITIATAGVKVVLRGLTLNGQNGSGAYGVSMTNGALLTIENCVFAGFANTGVRVNTAASVRVTDTTIRDSSTGLALQFGARATVTRAVISGNVGYGIYVAASVASTTTTADIADSTMDGNSFGVAAYSTNASAVVKVSVSDSRAVWNSSYGVIAQSDAGASVTLSVSNNIISNNVSYGIGALGAGTKVWASGNTVSDNGTGLYNLSGLFESAGNNAVRNNGTAISGAITPIATM